MVAFHNPEKNKILEYEFLMYFSAEMWIRSIDTEASRIMNVFLLLLLWNRDSSVGIETELRAGRSEVRISLGVRFSVTVQTDPGAHPASYTVGAVSFPGVKRSGRGIDHPPPSSARSKKE